MAKAFENNFISATSPDSIQSEHNSSYPDIWPRHPVNSLGVKAAIRFS